MNLNFYTLLRSAFVLLLAGLMAPSLSAQGYVAKDSMNVRDKHMMRQAMYEANQESFPAPRKNNWSIGIQKGLSYVSGDVRAERGLGIGINVRRALGHTFSLRGQLNTGNARGLNWRPNGGFLFNAGLNGRNDPNVNYVADASYNFVYYNYRMKYWDANLQTVINIGNISFNNREPKVSVFGFAGIGGLLYRTEIDATDENGQLYDYSGINTPANAQDPDTRKDVLNSLRNLMDGEYETQAESHAHKGSFLDRSLIPVGHLGIGIAFKMSRRVDLALEHRVTWTGDDLVDGQRWEETNTLTANTDYLQFTTIGINFRIGKGEESLWWQNPLTTIYDDVRDLKRFGDKDEKDSDMDGVPDSRDKEAGTPEGVLVDMQGRALDSDGDGIQDFRDKEPFSPKGAEVDAGGVAKDSDNDGVIDFFDREPNSADGVQADAKGKTIVVKSSSPAEDINKLPMVNFDLGKSKVKEQYYPDLFRVATLMQDNPDMKVRIIGNADVRGRDTKNDALSKARAEAVLKIMTDVFQLPKDRFVVEYNGSDKLLVQNLPGIYSEANEPLHYLNRRVELKIVE